MLKAGLRHLLVALSRYSWSRRDRRIIGTFGEMFQAAFNMQGVVPNNEAIVALALNKFGTYTALIMLVGMAFNILIARITRFKYIYLTGHATLYMACMIAVILSVTIWEPCHWYSLAVWH